MGPNPGDFPQVKSLGREHLPKEHLVLGLLRWNTIADRLRLRASQADSPLKFARRKVQGPLSAGVGNLQVQNRGQARQRRHKVHELKSQLSSSCILLEFDGWSGRAR